MDGAVALAVRQNPRLTAATRDVAAAQAGVRSARALTNPNLTFTPAITPGGSDEELLVQQPLELNGTRRARTGVAQAQLRQTQAQALVELRQLVFETKIAYYDLARAQELRAVAADLLRNVEEFERGVRRQAEEGLRPGIDRVQAAVEVNRARQQLTQAESQVTRAQAALNTLLGRQPAEPVGTLAFSPIEAAPADVEALVSQAVAARAEIDAEEAQRQAFLQEARLARAQGRPDLVPQLRAGSLTRGVEDAGVGIGISVPFLDYGSRRNRIRQAELAARAQEARIASRRAVVRQEVEQALARLRAAEAMARSYEGGTLDQARRLLEASQTALRQGAPGASILTVLEAQRTYRSVLSEYTNALAEYAQARAELERATGSVPPSLPPSPTSQRSESR